MFRRALCTALKSGGGEALLALVRFVGRLPTGDPALDSELAQLLVYLQAPQAAERSCRKRSPRPCRSWLAAGQRSIVGVEPVGQTLV